MPRCRGASPSRLHALAQPCWASGPPHGLLRVLSRAATCTLPSLVCRVLFLCSGDTHHLECAGLQTWPHPAPGESALASWAQVSGQGFLTEGKGTRPGTQGGLGVGHHPSCRSGWTQEGWLEERPRSAAAVPGSSCGASCAWSALGGGQREQSQRPAVMALALSATSQGEGTLCRPQGHPPERDQHLAVAQAPRTRITVTSLKSEGRDPRPRTTQVARPVGLSLSSLGDGRGILGIRQTGRWERLRGMLYQDGTPTAEKPASCCLAQRCETSRGTNGDDETTVAQPGHVVRPPRPSFHLSLPRGRYRVPPISQAS